MKISVIIPVYNGEKTIGHCLSSVLNQSYHDYEVVVVDNNSTDDTRKIITDYQAGHRNLRLCSEPVQSVGAAHNRGITNARGDIFMFTDSDCIVPPDWIEKLSEPIRDGTEKAVVGFESDLVGNFWTRNIQEADWEYMRTVEEGGYVRTVDGKNFSIEASLMREFMFDPAIVMLDDYDLYVRIREATKIRFLPDVRVGHFHRSSFMKTLKMNFVRGYWSAVIYQRNGGGATMDREVMTRWVSGKDSYKIPCVLYQRFKKMRWTTFAFALISGAAWIGGIVWAKGRYGRPAP